MFNTYLKLHMKKQYLSLGKYQLTGSIVLMIR